MNTASHWCELSVGIAGRCFNLRAPSDPDDQVRAEQAARTPSPGYWAHLWDSARALAEHIGSGQLVGPGTRVLEIGCGLGLPGLVAAWRGGDVLLTDFHHAAISAAMGNARLNALSVRAQVYDWNDPPPDSWEFDLLIGADVLYEHGAVEAIAVLIRRLGCPALLCDPLRPASSDALSRFACCGLRCWMGPPRSGGVMLVQPEAS